MNKVASALRATVFLAALFLGSVPVYAADGKYAAGMTAAFAVSAASAVALLILYIKVLREKNAAISSIEKLQEQNGKLAEAKERRERIINAAPISILTHVDNKVVEINERMTKFTGLKIGDDIRGVFTYQEQYEDIMKRFEEEKLLVAEVASCNLTDGKTYRCLMSLTSVEYEGHEAVAIWANEIEDLERQKDRMKELHQEYLEEYNKLEGIINTSPIVYVLTVDGVVVEQNDAVISNFGSLIGQHVRSRYPNPSNYDAVAERIMEGRGLKGEILPIIHADGSVQRYIFYIASINYKNQVADITWGVNIEESERQKDMLQAAHVSLQNILDSLPIPARIVDLEHKTIVYANDSFLELFEYESQQNIYGRKMIDIMRQYQEDGVSASEKVDMVSSSEEGLSIEMDYITATGKVIHSLLVARQLDYNGRKASVGIIRDLSKERREAELRLAAHAAEEASRAKSMFLAHMSHEIRTPMNAIVGFADLASDPKTTVAARENHLKNIRESSAVLLNIIDDILDISKIEAQKMELEKIPFNIHDIFTVCQTLILPKAKEKGVTLYCYSEPAIGKMLLGDPTRLRQALLNLLSNAVKFTNTGIVKLMAAIDEITQSRTTIRFEVKDSGIGMSPEQIERIFKPFIQADNSTTRQYGGTGLGLAITKSIIELMGGNLVVESAAGVGSRFSFTLSFDIIDVPDGVSNSVVDTNLIEQPVFKGLVLVCEDNAMNQQVICEHLAKVGLDTVVAANGAAGVEFVRGRIDNKQKPFDLIFMDIHMPVMDGLEASAELQKIGNTAPIIALTANIMPEEKEFYKKSGMLGCLSKPFRSQTLWACLLKYITPLEMASVNAEEEAAYEKLHQTRLRVNFVKDNKLTYNTIAKAIETGDIKLAHRLAHTLKSVAGLVSKDKLQEAAGRLEASLKGGNAKTAGQDLEALKRELTAALDEFAPLFEHEKNQPEQISSQSITESLELLDKLDELLAVNDMQSLNLTRELRGIPGAEALIDLIEEFEFKLARESLEKLRQDLRQSTVL